MAQVKVAVYGCAGRMGRRLCVLAASRPDLALVAAMDREGHPLVGRPLSELEASLSQECKVVVSAPDLVELLIRPDVIVDFSTPNATISCVRQAAQFGIPVIIGTTGLSPEQEQQIKLASQSVPVIHAMNFSLGVNLLLQLVGTIASTLDEGFNIEIVETHHDQKVDAPSGTALALADSICQASSHSRSDLVHGRQGQVGRRASHEIGMHAMRMKGVIGDHTVYFGNEFERIEVSHHAQNRDVFASGALKAAQWLVGKPPGMYTMADVLFKNSMKQVDLTN